MIDLVLDVLSWVSICAGVFFMIVGAVGVLRMPDVLTRLHAAGMTDTMGAAFLFLGMCFQAGIGLLTVRLLFVYAFLLLTNPIGTHALARAALASKQVLVRPHRQGN